MSGYYLQTVPQSVKAAWQETLEETGFNPFQTDVTSILTQLSVEQDFLTGGDDNIFGETKESCLYILKDKPAAFGNPDYQLELPDKKTDQQRYIKHE